MKPDRTWLAPPVLVEPVRILRGRSSVDASLKISGRRQVWCQHGQMRLLRLSLLSLAMTVAPSLAGPLVCTLPTPPPEPFDAWEVGFASGSLWSVGNNATPLDYVLLPQILDLKTPSHFGFRLGSGDLRVRSRFMLEGAPIIEGPESYFFGLMGAPSIEWWPASRQWNLFASAGGGIGWMDSRGYEVPGGQGQDFNFTWFVEAGLRFRVTDTLSLSTSALFQHISNGGQDEVNPGIDSLGFTVGLSHRF